MELLPKQIAWKIFMLALDANWRNANGETMEKIYSKKYWHLDFTHGLHNLCYYLLELRCVSKYWNSRIRDMLVWGEHRGKYLFYTFRPEVTNLF